MTSHFGSKQVGAFMILIGLVALIGNWIGLSPVIPFLHWSLFIILPGLALVLIAWTFEDAGKVLAPVGFVLTTTGMLLAYQSWADHYQSWAYAWTLTGPAAIGLGGDL